MINMKIRNKLFLVLFGFSLLLVATIILMVQWSIAKGMIDYVQKKEQRALMPLVSALQSEYAAADNWQGLAGGSRYFGELIYTHLKGTVFLPPPPKRRSGTLERRADSSDRNGPPERFDRDDARDPRRPPTELHAGYILLDKDKHLVIGEYVDKVNYNSIALSNEEQHIGWLLTPRRDRVTDGYELDFIEQQQSYLWAIAIITMLLVSIVASLLAGHLAEPIKLIMRGMHKLTQGDYQQKVDLKRSDELGELSRDFNELAVTLYENESARKRWLANISHELRTPVAILRGELEAMLDGVRPVQRDNIESANDEVKHLQTLIDDLHQLTSADIGGMHYRKKDLDLRLWLQSEAKKYSSYLAADDIQLVVDSPDTAITIFADDTRLCQLFENLMNNCCKYSEADTVKISLLVEEQTDTVTVCVEDNGVGVPQEHLEKLFEHLYRVESSRNRKSGGSGLGLSICAHIVTAHQGEISAELSELGGLAIVISLPLKS